MVTLCNDIKYALRQLRKSPGFTLTAVLTLAVGIGVNITMFSVVHAVLLRPLPFENPDQLVVVRQRFTKPFVMTTGFSYPDFLDWKEQSPVFQNFAAYTPSRPDMIDKTGVTKIDGAIVSPNFFSLLGTSAHLGRTFTEADERQNDGPLAVITYRLWRSRFEQDQDILGRAITLQDRIYTIVGVLPRGFNYPESLQDAQVWTLLNPTGDMLTNRHDCWLNTVGRLRPGISIGQAIDLQNQWSGANGNEDAQVLMMGLHHSVVSSVRATLWILSVIVGFILLIVCANVTHLCLARASSRNKEMVIRSALGANTWRLLRQFITENILLSLAGGTVGLIFTVWTVNIFKLEIADFVPMADTIRIQPRELFFGLGLSLLAGLFLGITPFLFVQRSRTVNVLTERQGQSGPRTRLSNVMIAGQIAAALILSIGMVMMIRSMMRLSSADIGFNRDNLITFNIGMKEIKGQQRSQFSQNFLMRLSALPSVKSVSTDSSMPSSDRANMGPVTVDGYESPDGKPIRVIYHNVSEDYFNTLQIPMRKGRSISPAEQRQKDSVVVISEGLADRCWTGKDPIGEYLTFCGQRYRVIGVAADMIQGSIKFAKPNHLFFPFDTRDFSPELKVVVRSTSEPGAVIQQTRTILRDIDATLPLYGISTFKAQMNRYLGQERFTTAFLTIFSSIAILLIVIGIYGVISCAVTKKTRDIGIRMALGAQKTGILAMILRQGLVLVVIGSVIGIAGALGLTRFLSCYLYEISAFDPATFVLALLLITAVSMLACWIPARRVARIDPMEALRYE